MKSIKLIQHLCLAVVLTSLAGCYQSTQPNTDADKAPAASEIDARPNILFIIADDMGFTDLGSFGSEIPTPNLDELAMQGLRLTSLHAGPACQETRAMLMASTGYARAIETRPLFPEGERDNLLSRDWAIIPELMQEAGYATFMTGKWDLGWHAGYTPATRGFDKSFAQIGSGSSFFREHFFFSDQLGFEEDGVPVAFDDLDEDFYVTDHYTDKMLEYLQEADSDKPWFSYMAYTAPHWPLQLPEDWLDRYAGKYDMGYDQLRLERVAGAQQMGVLPPNLSLEGLESLADPWEDLSDEERNRYARAQEIYAGMVEHMDMSIGRVIQQLRESGELDNTIILFSSDHGASGAEHGVGLGRYPSGNGPPMAEGIDNSYDNFGRMNSFVDHGIGFGQAATAPFTHYKGVLNEGGLRAASFVYYPKDIEAGGVSHSFMTMMDIMPTFLEIAGTEHPGASSFNGREIKDISGNSAWPYLTGQSERIHPENYVAGWSRNGGGALVLGDYKIVNTLEPGNRELSHWRLYNLVADPGERQDLSAQHPNMVAEMVSEWEADWE